MKTPELVFGIVGATGTDLASVSVTLDDCLQDVDYTSETVRVIDLLTSLSVYANLPSVPEELRITKRMDAGDDFRNRTARADALAAFSIGEIATRRCAVTGDEKRPAERRAYVLRSLKRPEEVSILRRVYGDGFFLVGAYAPRSTRVNRLADIIARSHHAASSTAHRATAERLIQRDIDDPSTTFGQRLRDTFALADVFIRSDDVRAVREGIRRFIEALFGHPFHTPSRDEAGMYLAHVAALRSAALPRQVGVALTSADGSVLTTGCNDVPRSGGGQYWEGDDDDKRDHMLGWDASDMARADMAADVFERLRKKKWLAPELEEVGTDELVRQALSDGGPFKNSQLTSIVEFGRVIHAEMAALTDAARRGVSTQGATLYTTTFPCHNCARHIVSAGVSRVVYVEPYPKSRAIELHQDAIVLEPAPQEQRVRFEPFVGIGARLYPALFRMVRRKDAAGRAAVWHARGAAPRMAMTSPVYVNDEQAEIANFLDRLREIGLLSPDE